MTFIEENCVLIVDHFPNDFLIEDLPFDNMLTGIHVKLENNCFLKVLLKGEETEEMYSSSTRSVAYFSLKNLLSLHSYIILYRDEGVISLGDLAIKKFNAQISHPTFRIIRERFDNRVIKFRTPFRCRSFNSFLRYITKTLLKGIVNIVNNNH